jgi:hypothetical protein
MHQECWSKDSNTTTASSSLANMRPPTFALVATLTLMGVLAVHASSESDSSRSGMSDDVLPLLNMTGFAWAENMVYNAVAQALFVSDTTTGTIWKVTLDREHNRYTREVYLRVLKPTGLCNSEDQQTVYAAVLTRSDNTHQVEAEDLHANENTAAAVSPVLIAFDPVTPRSKVIFQLPQVL